MVSNFLFFILENKSLTINFIFLFLMLFLLFSITSSCISAATTLFTDFFFAAVIACIPEPVPISRTLPKANFLTYFANSSESSLGS